MPPSFKPAHSSHLCDESDLKSPKSAAHNTRRFVTSCSESLLQSIERSFATRRAPSSVAALAVLERAAAAEPTMAPVTGEQSQACTQTPLEQHWAPHAAHETRQSGQENSQQNRQLWEQWRHACLSQRAQPHSAGGGKSRWQCAHLLMQREQYKSSRQTVMQRAVHLNKHPLHVRVHLSHASASSLRHPSNRSAKRCSCPQMRHTPSV